MNSYDYNEALRWRATQGDVFSSSLNTEIAFRETIQRFILSQRPFWARVAYLGRRRVLALIEPDGIQCLDIAGLLSDLPTSIAWWDSLASMARRWSEEYRLAAGREAEAKTFALETARLLGSGLEPEWIGRDDNTAGYDVLSWRRRSVADRGKSARAWRRQHIEVKASTAGGPIHLSDNEWKFASANVTTWELQIWVGRSPTPVTLIFSQVEAHIPRNAGQGKWTQVEISTRALVGEKLLLKGAVSELEEEIVDG